MTRGGYPKGVLHPWPERQWGPNGKRYRRISERDRELAKIPVCSNCGVRCTGCVHLKIGQAFADQPKLCCLIVAGKPE